jgi:hypothetical protein
LSIQIGWTTVHPSTVLVLLLAALSLAGSVLFFNRYKRFLTYKVTEGLLGLLLLADQKAPPEQE